MADERKWYEVEEKDRTPVQQEQAWICYFQSLLAGPHGRMMVCDMRRRLRNRIKGCAKTPELAVAQIWIEAFLDDSLTLAGVVEDIRTVESMVPIARAWKPPAEPKPYVPPGYADKVSKARTV